MKYFILILGMLFFTIPAIAETYSWEDENGTVNFSEDLSKIPKKYRKKARVIGYEETAPAQSKAEQEQPARQRSSDVTPSEGRIPAAKIDKKAVYGGKDAKTWQAEFGAANADLNAAEKQLVDYRNRVKDISGMSRSEYLGIQSAIKTVELRVLGQRKKLDDLKQEAGKAEVPAEFME